MKDILNDIVVVLKWERGLGSQLSACDMCWVQLPPPPTKKGI